MKSKVLLLLTTPILLCGCGSNNGGQYTTVLPNESSEEGSSSEEPFSIPDDLNPILYKNEVSTADALSMIENKLIPHEYDYTTLKSASIHSKYGSTYNNYVAENGDGSTSVIKINGTYFNTGYGAFNSESKRLYLEFATTYDEDEGGRKISGDSSNKVFFWIDGDIGYEAYQKYSTEGVDTKRYYKDEGDDAKDLEDSITFETISEMITPQIDSWSNAYQILSSGEATNMEFYSDGTDGTLYGIWDYKGYHMELESSGYYMVYETIVQESETITTSYEFRYTYDEKVNVPIPEIDDTWSLGS